jgi:hypothetical protein
MFNIKEMNFNGNLLPCRLISKSFVDILRYKTRYQIHLIWFNGHFETGFKCRRFCHQRLARYDFIYRSTEFIQKKLAIYPHKIPLLSVPLSQGLLVSNAMQAWELRHVKHSQVRSCVQTKRASKCHQALFQSKPQYRKYNILKSAVKYVSSFCT